MIYLASKSVTNDISSSLNIIDNEPKSMIKKSQEGSGGKTNWGMVGGVIGGVVVVVIIVVLLLVFLVFRKSRSRASSSESLFDQDETNEGDTDTLNVGLSSIESIAPDSFIAMNDANDNDNEADNSYDYEYEEFLIIYPI